MLLCQPPSADPPPCYGWAFRSAGQVMWPSQIPVRHMPKTLADSIILSLRLRQPARHKIPHLRIDITPDLGPTRRFRGRRYSMLHHLPSLCSTKQAQVVRDDERRRRVSHRRSGYAPARRGRGRAFLQALAQYVAKILPKQFPAISGPRNRTGKIFIDYVRNIRGVSTAAPFSVI